MPFEIGQVVKQVVPVISGEIKDIQYDKASKSLSYLVDYTADGETHQRWFAEAQLEEVQPQGDVA